MVMLGEGAKHKQGAKVLACCTQACACLSLYQCRNYSFKGPGMHESLLYREYDMVHKVQAQALLQCNLGLTSSIEQL